MKRVLLIAALSFGTALGVSGCGGGGSSPADTITKPIDKAEDTANVANQREHDLESTLTEP